jgi:hypothetical protein
MLAVNPSRPLDAAIHKLFFGPVLDLPSGIFMDGGNPVPSYTSSIDAAVDLCNTVLPGWIWRLCTCHVSDDAWLMPDFNHPEYGERLQAKWPDCRNALDDGPGLDLSYAPSGRPALALIAVLLSVLEGLRSNTSPKQDESSLLEIDALSNDLSQIETISWTDGAHSFTLKCSTSAY